MPDFPKVNVIPTYSYSSKTLLRITTRFNETVRPKFIDYDAMLRYNNKETFDIADGVDGSVFSYTINYTDSSSGVVCKTKVISVTDSCVNGTCEHDSEVSPNFCFSATDITVIVSGIGYHLEQPWEL